MRQIIITLILLTGICTVHAQHIVQAEWFIGTDPGVGLGNPISVSTPGDSVELDFIISTSSLSPGLHQVYVRCCSDSVGWGVPVLRTFSVWEFSPQSNLPLISEYEYWIDNDPPTLVDITDSSQVNISELISTTMLEEGLHYLYVRSRDDTGRWGVVEKRPFNVISIYLMSKAVTRIKFNNEPSIRLCLWPHNSVRQTVTINIKTIYVENTSSLSSLWA